ncbi:replication-relaxation family protein [Streptomyces sp. NPDC015139]|uniref:replication-relaxation family protein n=1 Tax=Streptomyces sp. NPDC015139 TaxID=3364942 RepID=UPI0037010BEF
MSHDPRPEDRHPRAGFVASLIEPLAHELLLALAQHHLACTQQLQLVLGPDRTREAVADRLDKLRREQLVDCVVRAPSRRTDVWFLTSKGARITQGWPALRGRPPYPITSATTARRKAPHSLTVLRAYLAFTADARRRGNAHAHFGWTPQVPHAIGDRGKLVADAVLHATPADVQRQCTLRAFVEVDRSPGGGERLAAKMIAYARLWAYQPPAGGQRRQVAGPLWRRWYPVFPRLLLILTGAPQQTLRSRIGELQDMAVHHPLVAALAGEVPLGAVTLDDLEAHGATSPVWVPLVGTQPCSWTEL